ncbi:MAG: hypothetical protein ACYC5Q_16495 [Thermoleophilia bacterium]
MLATVGLADVLRPPLVQMEALEDASGVLRREVNPGVCSADEFRQKLRSGNAFLQNVVAAPKICLVGSDEELTASAAFPIDPGLKEDAESVFE